MQVDFLIIGQGISGSFLSYYLGKQHKRFLVIDNNAPNSPSRIAAGIINPVTGRRIVTVWMAEAVLPFAEKAYGEIGRLLNIGAIRQRNIIDLFPNPFMRENFIKRAAEDNSYLRMQDDPHLFRDYFSYEFGSGEIVPSYTAQLDLLLPAWRKYLQQNDQLLEEDFDIAGLQVLPGQVRYKDITAQYIIFCDGSVGASNPFFERLPYALNKGEALLVEIPGLSPDHIYKKSMTLAPLSVPGLFWIGSSYEWDYKDTEPTDLFRTNTEQVLRDWLRIPFKIVAHYAGTRPATVERRPFAGMHPVHKNVAVLNGMGSKGCSLAPFFASQLVNHICDGTAILPEADVNRFAKILSR